MTDKSRMGLLIFAAIGQNRLFRSMFTRRGFTAPQSTFYSVKQAMIIVVF
jgi:hypothetical protein